MKKRVIAVSVAAAVVIIAGFLFFSKKETVPPAAEDHNRPYEESEALCAKARDLAGEGRLLDAKELYKELIAKYPESRLLKNARTELDNVNMRLLFSPTPTEDSVFYEVQPGDTLVEISREFGTTVELIMKSNKLTSSLIKPGMRLKVSKAKYSILVDKSQNILMLKSGDEVLKTYSVATGEGDKTPSGSYNIVNKLVNPTWYRAGAIVPPESPENILGSRWMGLTLSGYGIHGTADESSIGRHVTEGCVRMRNKDVEELYSVVPSGTEVAIID